MSSAASLTRAAGIAWAFIRLGRPQFLLGGFATYGLGAAIARAAGHPLDDRRYIAGQAVVTCFQLMTHYANDYFDMEADCANRTPTKWSGGSRVLPAQQWMGAAALNAAFCFLALGVASAGWVLAKSVGPMVPVLSVAIPVVAWAYSAPPVRLHSRGIGELAAAIVVAAFVPWFACAIQMGHPTTAELAPVLPLVLIQFAMLIVIGVPDRQADASVGKRTFVVRFGLRASAVLHNALLISAYLVLFVFDVLQIAIPTLTVLLLTAPLACMQIVRVASGQFRDGRRWESLAFGAVALVLLSTLAELVGYLNVDPATAAANATNAVNDSRIRALIAVREPTQTH